MIVGHEHHRPVMVKEILHLFAPQPHHIYIDATFGCGGHTSALLQEASCSVIAFDRDPQAVCYGKSLGLPRESLRLIERPFSQIGPYLFPTHHNTVQGILFDLGVSSPQIDTPLRGFSFQREGPLDMRMNQKDTLTAQEIIHTFSEKQLIELFQNHGQEPRARTIARAIVKKRSTYTFSTTIDLAALIASVVPRKGRIHPATRVFQALRISVNNELEELKNALHKCCCLLAPGGILAVISFHSLEDGIVKSFMKQWAGVQKNRPSRHLPFQEPVVEVPPLSFFFDEWVKKPLRPSRQEVLTNPRARSARLRWARRSVENKTE